MFGRSIGKRNTGFFAVAFAVFEYYAVSWPDYVRLALLDNFAVLYLSIVKDDKLLGGLRDNYFWHEFVFPPESEPHEWFGLAYQILPFVSLLGPDEQDLLPTEIPSLEQTLHLEMPGEIFSQEKIAAYFHEVYFHPNFEMHPLGVRVQVRNGLDLQAVVLKQIGDFLLARLETTRGVMLASMNLDVAQGVSIETITEQPAKTPSRLAEIWHDIIVGKEVVAKSRRLREVKAAEPPLRQKDWDSMPRYRYLPRVRYRNGGDKLGESRKQFSGRRPAEPHRVKSHARETPITPKHYEELLQWQVEYGLRLRWNELPGFEGWDNNKDPSFEQVSATGCTIVVPHVRPKKEFRNMPTFIKVWATRLPAQRKPPTNT